MYDQNITAHEHQALLPQVCSFCFALNIQLHLSGSCSSDHDGLQCKLLVLTPCLHGSLLQLPSSFLLVLFFLQLACLLAAFLHSEGAKLAAAKKVQLSWGSNLYNNNNHSTAAAAKSLHLLQTFFVFLLLLLLFQLYYYSMNQQLHELPCK
jgi:hypothetical protein